MSKLLCSIVVPVYHNADSLPALHKSLSHIATTLSNYDFEWVFVDDGSTDTSLRVLLQLREEDSRIRVIKLARNFGAPMRFVGWF